MPKLKQATIDWEKNVTNLASQGTQLEAKMRETGGKKGLVISPFIIKFTYLFDLPTLFAYLACQFCYPFFWLFMFMIP